MSEPLVCISIILWMMPFQFKAGSCRLFTITTSAYFITRCSDATNVDTFDARSIRYEGFPTIADAKIHVPSCEYPIM